MPTTLFTEARSLVEPNKSLWVRLVKLASLPWGSCLYPPSAEITSIHAWLPYESWGSKLQDSHTLLGKCFNPTEPSPQLSFYKILSEVSYSLHLSSTSHHYLHHRKEKVLHFTCVKWKYKYTKALNLPNAAHNNRILKAAFSQLGPKV